MLSSAPAHIPMLSRRRVVRKIIDLSIRRCDKHAKLSTEHGQEEEWERGRGDVRGYQDRKNNNKLGLQ